MAGAGKDVVLTLDPALQRTAQTLLDEAIARRLPSGDSRLDASAGGAIVAIDVHSGAILAAAAAPRFGPGSFTNVDSEAIQGWLNDPARPLFNRTVQMALPPGSVFKVISAAAPARSGNTTRCAIRMPGLFASVRCTTVCRISPLWNRSRPGDHGRRSGPQLQRFIFSTTQNRSVVLPLIDWAGRLGLGKPTGVDLPRRGKWERAGYFDHQRGDDAARSVDGLHRARADHGDTASSGADDCSNCQRRVL